MTRSLKNHELPVLSACQTAVGDESLPEETVHLAAGMLAMGFKNVVGTMWSIQDSDAPVIADVLYSQLRTQITAGGTIDVVLALHNATEVLQERVGHDDFLRWAPYVHFGG